MKYYLIINDIIPITGFEPCGAFDFGPDKLNMIFRSLFNIRKIITLNKIYMKKHRKDEKNRKYKIIEYLDK